MITDLDSVDPKDNRKVCRADTEGAVTSNASLKHFLNKKNISELSKLKSSNHSVDDNICYVAFPKPVKVPGHGNKKMHGRTYEDTFAYQNISLIRNKSIEMGVTLSSAKDFDDEYNAIYEGVRSKSFKKTKFALDVATLTIDWKTPEYIEKGLVWLEERTAPAIQAETSK